MATKHECTQAVNIESIKGSVEHNTTKVDHIEQTLYQGNGKPAMTVQLAVISERLTAVDDRFMGMEKKLDNIASYGRAIALACLAIIIGTAWEMVKKHNAETYSTQNKQAEVSK